MTDQSNLDRETRDAMAALAYRLRKRDEQPDDDRADAEPFAHEFVMAMRLRGWRPTPLATVVEWGPPAGRKGADPQRHADEIEAVRAACQEASARFRAADRGGSDGAD
jgi:hypothetical protein